MSQETIHQPNENANANVSKETLKIFDVMRFPDSVPLQNVAAYIPYLLRKVSFDCHTCVQKILILNIP